MMPKCPFKRIMLPLIEEEMAVVEAAAKLKGENVNNFVADAVLSAARKITRESVQS